MNGYNQIKIEILDNQNEKEIIDLYFSDQPVCTKTDIFHKEN